ncbi:class II glutamine amidotransferase [Maritalea mediterranea]|uniref:Class II glutamine amidotransferase n=1 Tax=Maritalea mediterranea TaxID=2909667 RepID=A0ABS9E520_9HYPH|nr:class II glutamine amidotransferase [Maritalea mediterranea]MCF4097888.1 class II glutamine amidotransferase [Maritalea mediterranea]
MCRWIAYLGQPTHMEDYLYDGERALCGQAMKSHEAKLGVHGDGGGLGWYDRKPFPGLYRNAGPAWGDPNLRELTAQLQGHLFFAHVRASTGAPSIFVNCHPFRCDNWLFMHNGQIGGFDEVRRGLEHGLDDAAYRLRQGSTDSELIFALLRTNGLQHDPVRAIEVTLNKILTQMRQAGVKSAFRATFALADGDNIWAVRWSSDAHAPSLYQRQNCDHLLLASEPIDEHADNWREVPANALVHARRSADGAVNISQSFLFEKVA